MAHTVTGLLWRGVYRLPAIVARRQVRSGEPHLIPHVEVPETTSSLSVKYVHDLLVLLLWYSVFFISGYTEATNH